MLELLFVVQEYRYDARRPRKGAVDLLLASPSVLQAASAFTSEALARVTNRLRVHLEVLPRVAPGAHLFFMSFSFNFLADRQQRRGLKLCGPFSHVRVCADDGVSEISGDLERPT